MNNHQMIGQKDEGEKRVKQGTRISHQHVIHITVLTVVGFSKAANLSSCVAAAFSKASCFLMRFSTASSVSYNKKYTGRKYH